MKITEENNQSKLSIKTTKQNIDDKLGVPEPFINKCAVYVVSGGMGSGKSTWLNSVMTSGGEGKVFKGVFKHVHFSTPAEVFMSDSNHPFSDHCAERLHFTLTPEVLDEITDDCIAVKDGGGNSCLILDDWSEELKDKRIEKKLKKIIHKHRHYKLNILFNVRSHDRYSLS
jgi:hypothetical protein